ncbi:MAG: hypothetical protein LBO74_06315 [Candidatus Symbiothrix sp.]|jgi:hypothetical protein|nr:hypothetical protein [Candidatus Symbiothrix sp.]
MKQIIYTILGLFCIAGQAFAQSPEELRADLPEVEGWDISPDIEVFNRDNLYERINGAAPLFLENNFQEMTSLVYTQGDDYITIQAYRHASPEDAFGMYASERSSDMTHYQGIGGEAQGDEYGLFFFSGDIYVKMAASNEGEAIQNAMQEIARGLAGKIDPDANYPVIFDAFPEEELIPYTEAYITQNYIGHEFLKPAYTANYHLEGKDFQAFVIDGKTVEGAQQILSDYFNFTKQKEDFAEGDLLVKDRYNGNIPVVWKGQYIIGAFSENGEDFSNEIYAFLNRFEL